ncbi:MAG: FCD domain-containing protein, partial [Lachnospiraceae bacterium]|nr:FCD domain-containing protein [Lachnospiraceae bacterium]
SHADYTELDLEFHMLLAKACKNPLMIQTSEILRDVFLGNIRSGETRRDTKKSAEYHRRILEAIEHHDGELARSIMKEHMEVAEQELDRS